MRKRLKIVFALVVFTFCILPLQAQVTIGSGNEPVKAALLEVKDQKADEENVTATKGGFILPRVKLEKRSELNPFIGGASELEKSLHVGLIVYNLQEVEDEMLKVGPTYWDGEKWNTLVVEEIGKATFSIVNCASTKIEGVCKSGVPLTSGNIMYMTVNVEKPGTYTVMAKAEPHNGYYFYATGEFKVTGVYEIILNGAGTPINPKVSPEYDEIIIELNGEKIESCTKQLEIEDSNTYPYYTINCASIKVHGTYRVGKALTKDEYMTVTIAAEDGTQGASWEIETNTVGGIKFVGSGVLTGAGTYTYTLYGEGTPADLSLKTFTVSTNSESLSATCSVDIQPVIAQKKIAALGSTTYGFTSGGSSGNSCGAMIQNNMNYGNDKNSVVKYEGFSNVTVEGNLSNLARFTGADGSQPYDIIIITYDLTPNDTQRGYLTSYVDKGGVLIYLDQNNSARNAAVVGDIFGVTMSTPVNIGSNCNNLIKFENIDDEITNGPFGSVIGKQWGEDFSNSCGLTNLPTDAIVYSAGINAYTGVQGTGNAANVKATMLRHPSKNFFWCGDSGLIHGGTSTDNTTTPFWVGSVTKNGITYPKYPVNKPNYGTQSSAYRMSVSNSTLFANVMAWALKMAEEKGINTGK